MSLPQPASLRLAWWATSWLRGLVVADLVLDAVLDEDVTHLVTGLSGPASSESLVTGLAELRSRGATGLGAVFPREGDPVGLGGPADFTRSAIEAGEAVVVLGAGVGLVPHVVGPTVTWVAHPAHPRQLVDVGEADRGLRAALLEAAERLAALDVARWNPDVADALLDLRRQEALVAPPGVPARSVQVAARGLQALVVVELALESSSGAVTAAEEAQRRTALEVLDRAARRAVSAAGSPDAWPPD